jgi:NTE family protein
MTSYRGIGSRRSSSAWALGTQRGYIYIRGEYYHQARVLETAIKEAYAKGYLGQNILDDSKSYMANFHYNFMLKHIDIKNIQACSRIQLFIAATHVETGHARIFECGELSVDAVLASACIPLLFQAVEIDGEPYWDGGYMGNPVLWPLIYNTSVNDILLVQINPLLREGTPMRASEIINRMNEITFNSSLIAEMRAIHFVSKLYKENRLDKKLYRDMHIHMIAMDEMADGLNASSKLNTRWDFFQFLKQEGRAQAELWLKKHWGDLGEKSTVDIAETFLKPRLKKNT